MKIWKKSISIVAGLGLLANGLVPLSTSAAESKFTSLQDVAAVTVDQPQLQSKINAANEKVVSEDTLVIKMNKLLTSAQHKAAGATLVQQFSDLNYAVVKVKNKKDLQKVIRNYQKLNGVKSVSPSVLFKPLGVIDPKSSSQYQNSLLQLEKAQKLAGKNAVTVAVIDQGVDSKHPDLKGRLLSSYNTVNPMNPGSPDYHGTHVSGIIAANKGNGIGGYGVNPNAKILPIDVFDRGWGASDYAIANGILHAVEKGAKVINMSLGGPMKSPLVEEALKKAAEKNVVVIAAAGNTGDDTISYPAAYEGVISVGSINSDKKLSYFSSYGPSVDVVAPGEDIYSTMYDYEKKSTFVKMSGTSMASPMVAGVASLLLSKNPKLTPAQIEYILEETAEDLGSVGYDVKYANGLVNPVLALQYNVKKLPTLLTKKLTVEEMIQKATPIKLTEPLELEGEITMPYQEYLYKVDVEKGDNLQFVLDGASQYDYKLSLHLESIDGKHTEEINAVREGKKEGKLFLAPYSGTLVFSVKDVNGSYDKSARKSSQFTLGVSKQAELPADHSDILKPTSIQLPYQATEKDGFTLIGEKGDDDYFTFTVKEEQVVKIDLSALPGVDTGIGVYMADQIFPPDFNQLPAEEQQAIKDSLLSEDSYLEPAYYANKGGKSASESLSFQAFPEQTYYLKVTNNVEPYFGMYDYFFDFSMFEEEQQPESSLVPYSLSVEGKAIEPDEDMFPIFFEEEGKGESTNGQEGEEPSLVDLLADGAQPYEIGGKASGSLQLFEDEDWFSVTPSESGIYDFSFIHKGALPVIEVYEVREETDEDGEPVKYLNTIGTNMVWGYNMPYTGESMYTGLRKDRTYYVRVASDYYNGTTSFDPYEFTSKLVLSNVEDKYEDNDKLEEIKNLPASSFEANFSMPGDIDVFYYESKATAVQGVTIQTLPLSASLKKKYPQELQSPSYGVVMIFEDVNKNRKLDTKEYDRVQYIEKGLGSSATTYGSFRAEKGKNYIVAATSYVDGIVPISLNPYKLTLKAVNTKDEDKGSVVKNNIASKPLALKKVSSKVFESTGYLNAGVSFGDEDWYELNLTKDSKGKIELFSGQEVDGVISIYKGGKLVTTVDYYSAGDTEYSLFNLKKGKYQIKVRDVNGNTSIDPYKLKVTLN